MTAPWPGRLSQLALVELYTQGVLRRRELQAAAWDHLRSLRWTRLATRQRELELKDQYRDQVEQLLDQVWPLWRNALVELKAAELAPTPSGWEQLQDQQRITAAAAAELPTRLNRRVASALVGPHAKATLTEIRQTALAACELTADQAVRVRPHRGLVIRRGEHTLTGERLTTLLGEIIVPERALLDGLAFGGSAPKAIILVENLGPYIDLPLPSTLMAVHYPGWDVPLPKVLLERLQQTYSQTPLWLFGDIDPNGVAIYRHLADRFPLQWLVPTCWADCPVHPAEQPWPADALPAAAPAWVHELVRNGQWAEQEPVVLLPAFATCLQELAADRPPGGA
jgi:hypothetical protein